MRKANLLFSRLIGRNTPGVGRLIWAALAEACFALYDWWS